VDGHTLIVLVNGISASEIVAGALQDLDRAVVVGSLVWERFGTTSVDLTYGTNSK
jgi:carboxyl-terminal processing protease